MDVMQSDFMDYVMSVRPLQRHAKFQDITWLYRYFRANGRLLYVGITCDPVGRHGQHSRSASWWQHVRMVRYEWFPSQFLARTAERLAIRDENPDHNTLALPVEPFWPPSAKWYEKETGGRFIGVDPSWFEIDSRDRFSGYQEAPAWWRDPFRQDPRC